MGSKYTEVCRVILIYTVYVADSLTLALTAAEARAAAAAVAVFPSVRGEWRWWDAVESEVVFIPVGSDGFSSSEPSVGAGGGWEGEGVGCGREGIQALYYKPYQK